MRYVNSTRVARWLGAEYSEELVNHVKDWYGPPIPIAGTPWAVYKDGFIKTASKVNIVGRVLSSELGGFASLSDLIAEATGGKQQNIFAYKTGSTGVVGRSNTLFFSAGFPTAASAPSGLPNGTSYTKASTGAIPFINPAGGDTLHIISATAVASVTGNTLLLVDRLWAGAPALNTTSDQTITMSQSRYSAGSASAGIFAFPEVTTALAATAHNIRVLYKDQDNNTAETGPYNTGVSSAGVNTLDLAAGQWFMLLNSGDTGIYQLTGFTVSASLASGAMSLALAKVLAFLPCGIAYSPSILDFINSAFNLVEIKTDACLQLLEILKPATTATNYTLGLTICSG